MVHIERSHFPTLPENHATSLKLPSPWVTTGTSHQMERQIREQKAVAINQNYQSKKSIRGQASGR